MKCNQPRSGFELVSPCPFPMTVTLTPRCRIQAGHSHACEERIWQLSSVIINYQTENRAGQTVEVNRLGGWRHTRKRYPGNFGILKKIVSWGSTVDASSWVFRIRWDQINLGHDRQRWVEILYTTRCAARSGGRC